MKKNGSKSWFLGNATIAALLLSIVCSSVAFANGGIGYKGLKVNLNGSSSWYNVHGVSWGYQGCGDYGSTFYNSGASNWGGTNLGTFTSSATLQITGYAVVGWTDNTDYVSGKLEYKVWKQGDAEPGTWTVINIGNYQSPTSGATQVVCTSGNDRVVGYNNGTTSFQPGVAGTYNFKVRAFGRMQYTGGGGGSFNANDGTELTATFTITAAPAITSTSSSVTSNNTQTYRGATITINGTTLSSINAVKIGGSGGTSCTNVSVVSATQVTAVVPNGTAGGTIWISDGTNTATSSDSYTNLGFISNATGGWNTGGSWLGSSVPASGVAVTVANGHTITLDVAASVSGLTINSGGVFNNGTAQTLTINSGGNLSNNGTFTASTGSVTFSGTGTISGTVTFNNVNIAGGVNFGTSSTINGNLTINSGGFVNTNAPSYGGSSTLIYNTGGTYGRSLEWGTTSGAGYPNNITLQNNTTLNAVNAVNSYKRAAGNLTIASGSTFSIADLTVGSSGVGVEFLGNIVNDGSITLSGTTDERLKAVNLTNGNTNSTATVTLAANIGGDLELTGNYTDNANFTANNRAVFFTGSGTQTIGGTASAPFNIDYIVSIKSGGSIQLNTDLLTGAPNGGNGLTLTGATDILNLNGRTYTLGSSNQTCTVSGSGFIRGSSSSSMTINGTGALGTLNFETGNRSLANLIINKTSTGASVTLGTDLTVATALTLTSGALDIGSNALSLSGSVSRSAGTISASSGTVTFNGSSAQTVPASTFTSNSLNNLNIPNTNGVTLSGSAAVTGTLTVNGLLIPGASDVVISGAGTLTGSGTIRVTRATGTADLSGQYTLNRTLTNLTAEFAGAAGQGISAATLGGLKLNNSNGLSLGGNVTVSGGVDFTSGNLTIGANTLSIGGAVSRTSGNFVGSAASSLTLNGTAGSIFFQSGGSSNSLKALTLGASGSATLGSDLNIVANDGSGNEGVVTVNSTTGGLSTGGFLTLRSASNGTARIAAGRTSGGYITGAVTVERFIPQNSTKSWRLLAANTTGQSINAAWQEGQAGVNSNTSPGYGIMITGQAGNDADAISKGLDKKTPGYTVLRYAAESDALWGIDNTLTTLVDDYSGYFVYIRGDRSNGGSFGSGAPTSSTTLRSKGSLMTGDRTPVTIPSGRFALIGNPYPSRIDLRNVTVGSGIVNAFQVWDPKLSGSYGLGAYQTLTRNGSNYTITPGGGSYGSSGSVHNFIESGSAFFMESNSNSNNTVTITESAKASGSSVVNRPANPASLQPFLTTNLNAINAAAAPELADGNRIDFDPSYSNQRDVLDVRKHSNFGENLGLFNNNIEYIVERRAMPTETDTILYRISGLKQMPYRIDFMAGGLAATGLIAILEDTYLNTRTPLSLEDASSYSFAVDANAASSDAHRFRIVFRAQTPLPVSVTDLRAFAINNRVAVEWTCCNAINMRAYQVERSVDGTRFSAIGTVVARNNAASANAYRFDDQQASNGWNYYRIKCLDNDGRFKYTTIVKVFIGKAASSVAIYPNPVEGGSINLQLVNQPAGRYTLRFLSIDGRTVMGRAIEHSGGNATQQVALPAQMANGHYRLEVMGSGDAPVTVLPLMIDNK